MKLLYKKRSYEINMTEGPMVPQILKFAIPLMFSSMLQLLFNSADMIVVGQFAGSGALAAVGSTTALINLIINIFVGLSVGSNVVIANHYGAGRYKDVRESVHTAIAISLAGGVMLAVIGIAAAVPMLRLMGTPDEVITDAALYMRIYFLGMPVIMLYNFGSAIFRAIGDTRRPLLFLSAAGLVNIALNLVFVILFDMGVAGVAWATIISQCLSSGLIVLSLCHSEGCFKLRLKKIRLHKDKFIEIMKIGIPSGLQGVMFSISNVLLQASVNSLGKVAMAGCAADTNIEHFVYFAMNAFHHTVISFTAQNYGAMKYSRMKRAFLLCLGFEIAVGLAAGWGVYLLGDKVVSIFNKEPEVIEYALQRMSVVATTYFLCGMQEIGVGYLRGIGESLSPMLVSFICICGVRIAWIYTVFPAHRNLTALFTSYPLSWLVAFVGLMIIKMRADRKLGIAGKNKLQDGESLQIQQ